MLQARSPGRATANLIDAAIATTGIGLFSWIYLIEPYVAAGPSPQGDALAALYPLLDVALAAVAARILIGAGLRVLVVLIARLRAAPPARGRRHCLLEHHRLGRRNGPRPRLAAAYIAWGLAALDPSMAKMTEPSSARRRS